MGLDGDVFAEAHVLATGWPETRREITAWKSLGRHRHRLQALFPRWTGPSLSESKALVRFEWFEVRFSIVPGDGTENRDESVDEMLRNIN